MDPFYRYKRMVLQPSIVSKNGGSTTIKMSELELLAKQLERQVCDLITHIKRSCKTSIFIKGEILTVRKVLSKKELDDIIEEYIESNILCTVCGNPETLVKKSTLRCKACGSVIEINKL